VFREVPSSGFECIIMVDFSSIFDLQQKQWSILVPRKMGKARDDTQH
jgi:hypothetical protein